ncbi:MAG: ATP-binding protein [Thiohalomonadales bacterium]
MSVEWKKIEAAIWRRNKNQLRPVKSIDPIKLSELLGIEHQKEQLAQNTRRFIAGYPANNALLWGARGTGKSSLVKAILNEYKSQGLRLIEVNKSDLHELPEIVDELRDLTYRFIVYCDDFSFEANESAYVGLKTILEGSIEQPPENILLYATSNRRHLMPEYMQDNLDTQLIDGELHYSDTVEEKISLSDRFGLWLSFHPGNMDAYLAIVDSLFADYQGNRAELHETARMFSMSRASKSGRTAKQFYKYFSSVDI